MARPPTHVRPPAEIDATSVASLDEQLSGCPPEGVTLVDFTDVVLCESVGVRVLATHATAHVAAGGELRVDNASAAVRRSFRELGVEDLLAGHQEGAASAKESL